jgi:hypothetical protein
MSQSSGRLFKLAHSTTVKLRAVSIAHGDPDGAGVYLR